MAARVIAEHEWVKMCMSELCKKAGFADCHNLVQRDLEFVCDSIESKTGVLISLSTIKRLLNGQFSRQPQVATLNAIATFLGYQNWQDFKVKKGEEKSQAVLNGSHQAETVSIPATPLQKFSTTRYILIGGLLIATAVALFAFLKFNKSYTGNFDKAQFSMNKTTSNDLPNTVVFNYNIDEVNADSFFIQQSWDKNRRVRIEKNSHTLTDIYYEPGYHVAKLIANDKVIKTIDVSIPTDRWFYYAKERVPRSIAKYITSAGFKNGSMKLDKEEAVNSQVDVQKENVYVHVYFPAQLKYSSENYKFQFRIRVHPLNNDFCPFFMAEVFCQRYFMYFKSYPKGCASEVMAQYGEHELSGKTNDLSSLGTDVKEWQEGEVIVKDKKVTIRINNAEVFSTSYEQPSGLITGLGFISNGFCEVDFVNLQTLDGKTIYQNDFEK